MCCSYCSIMLEGTASKFINYVTAKQVQKVLLVAFPDTPTSGALKYGGLYHNLHHHTVPHTQTPPPPPPQLIPLILIVS